MTREQTRAILNKVFNLYATKSRKLSAAEKTAMLGAWADVFSLDDYNAVDGAVNAYVRSGKVFLPEAADIINVLTSDDEPETAPRTEDDRLWRKLTNVTCMLHDGEEHRSVTDPGGFRWDPELKRNVYRHPDAVLSKTAYTQFDFMQLPPEIQEYVEDIQGLIDIWYEISNDPDRARRRFAASLPGIRERIRERSERNIEGNAWRLGELLGSAGEPQGGTEGDTENGKHI